MYTSLFDSFFADSCPFLVGTVYVVCDSWLEEIKRNQRQEELDNLDVSRKGLEASYQSRIKILDELEHELQEGLKPLTPLGKEAEKCEVKTWLIKWLSREDLWGCNELLDWLLSLGKYLGWLFLIFHCVRIDFCHFVGVRPRQKRPCEMSRAWGRGNSFLREIEHKINPPYVVPILIRCIRLHHK